MTDARGVPFPNTIDGEHRGFLEWTWEKRARGMRLVVIGEGNPLFVSTLKRIANLPGQTKLGLEPKWHGHHERLKALRREADVGFEEPVEFEQWFVVENHVIELLGLNPRFF